MKQKMLDAVVKLLSNNPVVIVVLGALALAGVVIYGAIAFAGSTIFSLVVYVLLALAVLGFAVWVIRILLHRDIPTEVKSLSIDSD